MNTDIDFSNIAESDKAFVEEFENFVNGRVSNPEKTGMAMTTMHSHLPTSWATDANSQT